MVSIAFEKFILPNGLNVILHEDHSLPIAAVNIWYHVGSKDEDQGRTGFAHLFEHVMFEGSKNHNELFFNPLQKIGGSVNGSTTSDRTNYWENVPSDHLELALWLEADRMGFLLEALDQKRLDVQRDVVKNERRQSYENRPYGMSYLLLQPALFPLPHPYSWPVIGSQEDLDAASLEDIQSFFRRFYSPSNASLAIAGDINRDETRDLVERYFGNLSPAPTVNRIGRMESPLTKETRLNFSDNVQLPRLYLVWPSTPAFDDDEAPLDILATVLADGKSSRLYKTLVYEKQIAHDVSAYNYAREIAGEFNIQITANPGHDLEEIHTIVEEELDDILNKSLSVRELQRAKNRINSQHIRQLESIGGFGGRADQLNLYNVFTGDPDNINTDLERFNRVTSKDIQQAAKRWLNTDRVRMEIQPERPKKATSVSIDRSVMPSAGLQNDFSPPIPKRDTLSNGLDVMFIEKRELPVVAFGVAIRSGQASDPLEQPGLASITTAMLAEGTGSRSTQDIAEEMEFLGSQIHFSTSREQILIFTETLTTHWTDAFDILADLVQNPSFPSKELTRIRKERLTDLERIADDPMSIAQRATKSLLYGPDSIYGHPGIGTKKSISSIRVNHLKKHYSSYFSPQNATLIAIGDVDQATLLSKAEDLLGNWSGTTISPNSSPNSQTIGNNPTTIYLVDRPNAPQSVIQAGHVTIPRHDPDFFAMTLINYIFGAHATSRLFMNLRQDKGYSYGYYSNIDWMAGPSALLAGGSVQTAVTKESLIETIKEFSNIRGDNPITADEINQAKQSIYRSLPSQFQTQGQILNGLGRLVQFGLPLDYYATFMSSLESVSLEQVRETASRRIDDQNLVILVVGDRKSIESNIKNLGHPIVHVDMEGRPL